MSNLHFWERGIDQNNNKVNVINLACTWFGLFSLVRRQNFDFFLIISKQQEVSMLTLICRCLPQQGMPLPSHWSRDKDARLSLVRSRFLSTWTDMSTQTRQKGYLSQLLGRILSGYLHLWHFEILHFAPTKFVLGGGCPSRSLLFSLFLFKKIHSGLLHAHRITNMYSASNQLSNV